MKIRSITLGKSEITVPQNGFGALPIQRDDIQTAIKLLRAAYDGGMRFFDTARGYSDSEFKLGKAFHGYVNRNDVVIATKSQAKTPEKLREDLETSLKSLKTDYIDLYQLHCVGKCYSPDDGTGLYEVLLEEKSKGRIRHIGITTHKIGVAEEIISSGLYETLQFPFSYLASDRDIALVKACKEQNIGFIAMKALSGGLITNAAAAFAYIYQFDNVLPIWGVQRESELNQWLRFMEAPGEITWGLKALIEQDRKDLKGDFCRGCGYCMPCPNGIVINQCARIMLMIRRAPTAEWTNEHWQAEMQKIKTCTHCNACASKCPYGLETPKLLVKNLEDYEAVLRGDKDVEKPVY